jgi:hypothetical protein
MQFGQNIEVAVSEHAGAGTSAADRGSPDRISAGTDRIARL